MQAIRLPFFSAGMMGRRSLMSPLSRGDALQSTDGYWAPSTRSRRQAGSQGRSQVRPRTPGNTLDSRLSM